MATLAPLPNFENPELSALHLYRGMQVKIGALTTEIENETSRCKHLDLRAAVSLKGNQLVIELSDVGRITRACTSDTVLIAGQNFNRSDLQGSPLEISVSLQLYFREISCGNSTVWVGWQLMNCNPAVVGREILVERHSIR